MSARDVFIELKERDPSARIARAQEPRYFELGSSKVEMADARLAGAFESNGRHGEHLLVALECLPKLALGRLGASARDNVHLQREHLWENLGRVCDAGGEERAR